MTAYQIFWIVIALGSAASFAIEAKSRKNLRFLFVAGGVAISTLVLAFKGG